MTSREGIEAAIRALRTDKNPEPVERIMTAMAFRRSPTLRPDERDEALEAAMLAVLEKAHNGEPTPAIASQLGSIVSHKIVDVQRRKIRERRRFQLVEPENLPEIELADDAWKAVEDREALDALVADLERLKAENPRYFEAIHAEASGVPVAERLMDCFGENVSDAAARQLLHRARKLLLTIVAERKEQAS